MTQRVRYPILTIVIAQLFGTSLWFSANAAADGLAAAWGLTAREIGHLTIAVQAGFITGTLGLAATALADRYPASRIFAASAVFGALANAALALLAQNLGAGLVCRFLTGLALAGIYPLGMKLVVGYAPERAGQTLGWLVGMLTLGTALPHLVRSINAAWPWQAIVLTSSVLALVAAVMIARLGDGPHLQRSLPKRLRFGAVFEAFRVREFRASALGYFGHMWELYAFWTILPLLLVQSFTSVEPPSATAISRQAFIIIAFGALGCGLGGIWSRRGSSARVAAAALAVSASCCLLYPLLSTRAPLLASVLFLIWGFAVVADSPQFSALSAQACPPHLVGSALAIQNSIGFAITVAAIAVVTSWIDILGPWVVWVLLPGPVFGLFGLWPLLKPERYGAADQNQPRS